MRFRSFHRIAGALLLCAPAILGACADDPVSTAAPTVEAQDMISRIVAMGFQRDQVVDEGDHFRVEGDVIIYKRDLAGPRLNRSPAPGAPRYQWYTTNLVSQSNMAAGLRVNLSGISSNSAWTSAARSAMIAAGSTDGSKIMFVESTTADITFSFGSLPSGVIAQASFPASGLPGTTVTISTTAPSLSSGQKVFALTHELGHTIGYRHSDWQSRGESASPFGATQVPGTPSNDGGSVMRAAPSPFPSWSGFNSYDNATNRYLYPAPVPTLTSNGLDGSNHIHFEWNAIADVAGYQVRKNEWIYEWNYDPDGGYYGWNLYVYDMGTVTSPSYTSADTHDPASCDFNTHYSTYDINSIYPSGRAGQVAYGQTQFC